MITTNTLVRTQDPERFLESNFNIEDPIVLQLGGSSPSDMKTASAMARKLGFQEININAGCPSEKVSGYYFDDSCCTLEFDAVFNCDDDVFKISTFSSLSPRNTSLTKDTFFHSSLPIIIQNFSVFFNLHKQCFFSLNIISVPLFLSN